MQILGNADPAMTTEQIIEQVGEDIVRVIREEADDNDSQDRFWILRLIHRSYLYFRDLQNYSPQLYQSLLDETGVSGGGGQTDEVGSGLYDYSLNICRGYCRKLEAVLGNRMPNVIAVPNNPDDEECIRAAESANNAALYIREKCGLQSLSLYLVFGHFNFGTMFWHLDMIEDGDRFGWTTIPQSETKMTPLGNAAFSCPQCAATIPAEGDNPVPPPVCPQCADNGVQVPISMQNFQPPQMVPQEVPLPPIQQAKKGLEITLHGADEVSVPLDARSTEDRENCLWLRWTREQHKAHLLGNPKWGKKLLDNDSSDITEDTAGDQYAESIRSAMASPIGLVRSKRASRWSETNTFWSPEMYNLIPNSSTDQAGMTKRQMLVENFPEGLQITSVRGKVVDLQNKRWQDYWRDCKPEPTARIMVEPLSTDWLETQDLKNNYINQRNETMERSNMPIFCDPSRVDTDSLQNYQNEPVVWVPAARPAGGSLSDILFQPLAPQFSEQIPAFMQEIEATAQSNSGLLEAIWGGGDAEEPTARQAELKKNAALQQLGVQWSCMCRSLESLFMKACKLLAEFSDGVLEFSQKSQFGGFNKLSVVVADLKSDKFHFEADEAIPMTWGQQRDLLMWMLDKPAPLLQMWGLDDPLNIFEFKQLLGMPGERTPKLDDRNAAMDTIGQLLQGKPVPAPPGPPNPDGSPAQSGPPQPSVQPKWEEDSPFCAAIGKAYLIVNASSEQDNPDGFQNLRLWAQAHEAKANQPAPPPLPKTTVSLSLKGPDLGDPAIQSAATNAGLLPQGAPQVQSFPEKQAAYRATLGLGPQPVPEAPPLAQPMPPPPVPAGGAPVPLPPPGPASPLPAPAEPLPGPVQ
jgi:hypothetical protein